MFAVRFYTFGKRENSTARPSTVALDANCIIKTGSGIIEPTIELDIGLSEAPPYNYCYIPAFGRYYWIREWYFESALWTANLAIDVLATARSYIGSSSLYVLRAASAYDGSIIDALYPADTNYSFAMSQTNIGWTYNGGIYVMAIVSKNANFGSVRHFVLTPAQMSQLCTKLLSSSWLTGLGISSAEGSIEMLKCLIDPIQFIKSCIYIPVSASAVGAHISTSPLVVYDWDTEISGAASVNNANPVYSFINSNIQVADHPQASTRGKYLNSSPYTQRTLYVPPFGAFELDTGFLIDSDTISLEVNIDLTSGQGNLHVLNDVGREMNYIEGMVGVPINLSQVMRDWIGYTAAQGEVAAQAVRDPIGGIIRAATSGDAIRATIPKCQSVSGGGSFAGLRNGNTYLTSKFAHMVDDDLAEEGRPLCKTRTISSLSGYIKVKNGDIAAPYTGEELEKIRTYLEGGFYYE